MHKTVILIQIKYKYFLFPVLSNQSLQLGLLVDIQSGPNVHQNKRVVTLTVPSFLLSCPPEGLLKAHQDVVLQPAWLSRQSSNVSPAERVEDGLSHTTLLFLLRSKSAALSLSGPGVSTKGDAVNDMQIEKEKMEKRKISPPRINSPDLRFPHFTS